MALQKQVLMEESQIIFMFRFPSGGTNLIASNLSAGNYTLTVTDNNKCETIAYATIIEPSQVIAPLASNDSPVCEGDSVNLFASNIVGACYTWKGPNSYSSINQNTYINKITLSQAGTYSVTATINGCSSSASITTVTVYPTPSVPLLSNNGPLCVGDTLKLSAGNLSGASYTWKGPSLFHRYNKIHLSIMLLLL